MTTDAYGGRIPVIVTPDELDGGYVAECDAYPGCMGQGETIPEVLRDLADALEGVMELKAEEADGGR